MKTFSTLVLSMCSTAALVAVATAQPAPAAKAAPPAAKPEAKPAAGAPAVPTATKPAMPTATKPEMPATSKPPAEIAAHLKAMQGTWRCVGSGPSPEGQPIAMKATLKTKGDLDGWWIVDTYEGTAGKQKYRFSAYTTYDAGSKKWRRVLVDSQGGQMIGTSDGVKDNKMDFNLDTIGPMGSSQFRDHAEIVGPKEIKSWGELSMDKGRNWMKVFEMTCKK